MKQPIKMTPGDELHLTALMAPFSLNLVTGQDRQHLLGYGRSAFEAGLKTAAAAEQAAWHAGLDEGRAQAAPAAVAVPAQALTGEARAEAIKRLAPIRAKLATAAPAQAAPAAVAVPDERWCPDVCPITGRRFFGWIEHWKTGQQVPTYGGPFDSYTIPVKDEDGTFSCERFDHDAGEWMTEGMGWCDLGLQLVNDQAFIVQPDNPRYDEIRDFAEAPAALAATPAAAAQVVLPEPDVWVRPGATIHPDRGWQCWSNDGTATGAFHADTVRALLAGVSAPAAQAVTAPTAQDSCCAWSVWWTHDKAKHTTTRQASIAAWDAGIAYAIERIAPQAQADARDAAFEAVRKKFCKLQRYSFLLDDKGNVRRTPDYSGNWVEFEAVHTLFEPAAVDAAIAFQVTQGGDDAN